MACLKGKAMVRIPPTLLAMDGFVYSSGHMMADYKVKLNPHNTKVHQLKPIPSTIFYIHRFG